MLKDRRSQTIWDRLMQLPDGFWNTANGRALRVKTVRTVREWSESDADWIDGQIELMAALSL